MLRRRLASERGIYDYGWLQTAHTFSFNEYHDPAHSKFRALRVMNEDHVAPAQGFGLHPHRDMEIVTVVLSGTLAHEDSLGHRQTLRPDEVQWMSAGSGLRHSEFNHSADEPVHLYQIWLLPREKGLEPAYAAGSHGLPEPPWPRMSIATMRYFFTSAGSRSCGMKLR